MAEDVEDGEVEAPGGSRLKLVVIGVSALLLLTAGGGAGAYFMGLLPFAAHDAEAAGSSGGDHESAASAGHGGEGGSQMASLDPDEVTFVEMPDLLVNLKGDGKRMRFLKLKVALEVAGDEAAERVRAMTPRILDGFQLYLRSLEVDELQGAAAMYRLKEELIARINAAIEPVQVHDVLFKEMLVQ